jgi:hypothetical protein
MDNLRKWLRKCYKDSELYLATWHVQNLFMTAVFREQELKCISMPEIEERWKSPDWDTIIDFLDIIHPRVF